MLKARSLFNYSYMALVRSQIFFFSIYWRFYTVVVFIDNTFDRYFVTVFFVRFTYRLIKMVTDIDACFIVSLCAMESDFRLLPSTNHIIQTVQFYALCRQVSANPNSFVAFRSVCTFFYYPFWQAVVKCYAKHRAYSLTLLFIPFRLSVEFTTYQKRPNLLWIYL